MKVFIICDGKAFLELVAKSGKTIEQVAEKLSLDPDWFSRLSENRINPRGLWDVAKELDFEPSEVSHLLRNNDDCAFNWPGKAN